MAQYNFQNAAGMVMLDGRGVGRVRGGQGARGADAPSGLPAVPQNGTTGGERSGLADRILAGDRRAVARLITLIEDESPTAHRELRRLYPHAGRAYVVGITGPPGGGKSTLVRGLAAEFRGRGSTVGVLAVDPTSPFTGGAVLGDRVRMQELTGDSGVFIRSMASRGARGGLARAAADAVKVLDAFGSQVILVETVGVGQGEVEIAHAAHSTIVVEVPDLGDGVQVIKAGILEIADLFAVNKADREGADRAALELKMLLNADGRPRSWTPPIVKTVATWGKGIPELADALEGHLRYLKESGEMERRVRDLSLREILEAAQAEFVHQLRAELGEQGLSNALESVLDRRLDPRSAARLLVDRFRDGPSEVLSPECYVLGAEMWRGREQASAVIPVNMPGSAAALFHGDGSVALTATLSCPESALASIGPRKKSESSRGHQPPGIQVRAPGIQYSGPRARNSGPRTQDPEPTTSRVRRGR